GREETSTGNRPRAGAAAQGANPDRRFASRRYQSPGTDPGGFRLAEIQVCGERFGKGPGQSPSLRIYGLCSARPTIEPGRDRQEPMLDPRAGRPDSDIPIAASYSQRDGP